MADITYNGLTFNGTFTAPAATPNAYELMWLSCPAGTSKRAMVDHEFMGLDGIQSVDGGLRAQTYTLTGYICAADSGGIATAEQDIRAAQDGAVHDLVRWGVTLPAVELLEFKPGPHKTGSFVYCQFEITFRDLGGVDAPEEA